MGTFRFKQFSINDDGVAMKVGTDSVLLGAWCPVGASKRLLDIGTGSGLIALMLAQRSQSDAIVDAVEITDADAREAAANVQRSPWPRKVNIHHCPIQSFRPDKAYDLIVTNPPYFSNSLLPPDPRRIDARHDARLSPHDLLDGVNRLLDSDGKFCLVLPTDKALNFQTKARAAGLHIVRTTRFHTRESKPPERTLMSFAKKKASPQEDELVLYESGQIQTEAYRQLTADFYL